MGRKRGDHSPLQAILSLNGLLVSAGTLVAAPEFHDTHRRLKKAEFQYWPARKITLSGGARASHRSSSGEFLGGGNERRTAAIHRDFSVLFGIPRLCREVGAGCCRVRSDFSYYRLTASHVPGNAQLCYTVFYN